MDVLRVPANLKRYGYCSLWTWHRAKTPWWVFPMVFAWPGCQAWSNWNASLQWHSAGSYWSDNFPGRKWRLHRTDTGRLPSHRNRRLQTSLIKFILPGILYLGSLLFLHYICNVIWGFNSLTANFGAIDQVAKKKPPENRRNPYPADSYGRKSPCGELLADPSPSFRGGPDNTAAYSDSACAAASLSCVAGNSRVTCNHSRILRQATYMVLYLVKQSLLLVGPSASSWGCGWREGALLFDLDY